MLRFGLAGNPNSGKTTLFNSLTGSTAHVGNWAGVTVDRREGIYQGREEEITIIDLPGIYSLSPYTPEELIARNFLLYDTPDLIIDIVDATNMERNLYLTTQLLEIDCPIVIALNMMDLAEKSGDKIDIAGLEEKLGVPILPISAAKKDGVQALMAAAEAEVKNPRRGSSVLKSTKIGQAIGRIKALTAKTAIRHKTFQAIKILEKDTIAMKQPEIQNLITGISLVRDTVTAADAYGDLEAIVADLRYQYITTECVPFIKRGRQQGELTASEKADRLLTHKYLGIPIFFFFLFLVFHFTFSESFFGCGIASPGVVLKNIAESMISQFSNAVRILLLHLHVSDWAYGLIIEGGIGGVGAVLSFVPQILCLFLFLSILEDSGYMARAAFLMDRILRNFGLSGRAFLPLLMGFGCSVPAIMAARTLESEKDRRTTIMIVPYMSCGAKLPIYALFGAALFADNSDRVVFSMYLIGMITAVIMAIVLKNIIFQDTLAPFIMELPAYHRPNIKTLSLLLWEKLKDYLVRAGTILFVSTIVIWLLSNFDFTLHMVKANSNSSMLGRFGQILVPFFRPLGFVSGADGWKVIAAILTGLIAREAVVSTMGVLYSPASDAMTGEAARGALLTVIANTFTPLAAISFMVFNLLCIPCIAAVSAMHAEMRSLKWTLFTLIFWVVVAWAVSFLIFQGGTCLGLNG